MSKIDGRQIAKELKAQIKQEVRKMERKPGLAVVLVGEDPASKVYVNSKEKACKAVGLYSEKIVMSSDTSQQELEEKIRELNKDEKIDGILVQMPLPKHLDEKRVIDVIDPEKDVDCFHPRNVGEVLLMKKSKQMSEVLAACTPKGIIRLIKSTGVEISGKKVVVIGRSHLVGKPVALLLLAENATVEICHSRTEDLKKECLTADIIVAAVGRPKMVTADMIKEGAVVIDVGINRTEEGLVGDVDYDQAEEKASYITPVPGGVGPMTIACLLENTLILKKRKE